MSFDEEWASARATAVLHQESAMRLNQLPADGGGGGGSGAGSGKKLHVDSGELRGRAGKADTVRTDFAKADDAAAKETGDVAAGLKGFRSAPAFKTFTTRWSAQMKYVDGLLANGVAGALRESAAEFDARERTEKARHGKGAGNTGSDRNLA
ncbi:hypothetical protein ACIGEZ_05505 [Streptomyces sp. NPDC085481]|uniref:hypothetical protein n=1 Tax=Streptomyces sp. NPDC085481 TaxID=3365727 RepID=UPI0037D0A234